MTQPCLFIDCPLARTSLDEQRKLCNYYQLKAAAGLAKKFGKNVFAVFERARKYPQGEDKLGLSFFLAGISDMELWAALDRFLWLCDEIWIAECKQMVSVPPALPYDYREKAAKAFAA